MLTLAMTVSVLLNLAAQTQYFFDHLSLEEGVSHNLAFSLLQDSRGYMWLGTMYGLVKYDGYSYTTYRHNPDDPNSLSNDDIVTMHEDKHGNLFIGTYGGGLNKFDRTEGKIFRYTHDPSQLASIASGTIWTICEDHSGILWLGTNGGGLDRFDPKTNRFTHFKHDSLNANSLGEDIVFSVIEDSLRNLWIGTQGSGLDKLDSTRNTFTHFRNQADNQSSLGSNNIRKLYIDKKGFLWVCTYGGGVNKCTGEEGKFLRWIHRQADPNSISADDANTIIEDKLGIFWIGTTRGLNRFDPESGTFTHFYHRDSDVNSLSSDEVVALMEDRSGLLWIGTYHGGIDKLYTGKRLFSLFSHIPDDSTSLSDNTVHSMIEDHAGVLWVGTDKGLNRFDDSARTFQHYRWNPKNSNTLSGNIVNAIAEDRSGNLWIGTRRGLSRLDKNRREFSSYRHDPSHSESLGNDVITSIHASRKNASEIWIGLPDGLDLFNTEKETFTHYNHFASDSTTLSDSYVLSIYEDRAGTLWVGTFGGLNKYDRVRNTFEHFVQNPYNAKSLSNNYCLSMLEDRSGALWIGTGGGLNRFDPASATFSHLTRKNGLPNGVICGIIEDDNGVLWVSTYSGVSKFDKQKLVCTNYSISDGLQSNMFSPGAFVKRKNGQGVFGGINGFNIVNTDSIPRNTTIPLVAITSFMLFDNTNKNLSTMRPDFSSITLSYKENFFAIGYAAMDFMHPGKNQYACKLDGFDPDWVYTGNTRFVRYMNLSPGEYVFRVKGSNSDGVWNDNDTVLRIILTPPFWKTWWFYSLSAMTLFGLMVVFYNYRVKEKVNLLTEIERVRSAENKRVRKRAADDFHDEFGHKLTKISLLGQVIKKSIGGTSAELEVHLDKIIQTSTELSMGMRDFLWTLNPDKDSAYDVAIRLKDFGDELFNGSGIGFRMNGMTKELDHIHLGADWRRHLALMFKEAMNNVVKHSGAQDVSLDITQRNGSLDICLTDDGEGFNVHDNFTGQGLTSMRTRAEKIHGELTIESENGKGTMVKFSGTLPLLPGNNGTRK